MTNSAEKASNATGRPAEGNATAKAPEASTSPVGGKQNQPGATTPPAYGGAGQPAGGANQPAGGTNQSAPNYAAAPVVRKEPSQEITVIAPGTKIVGDINADGGLRVGGEIKGNIQVAGKLELNGKIIGDIEAEDITVSTSMVKGNVVARSTISLDKDTTVVGDVSACNAELDGKIKGNLTVKERAHMQSDSILMGNLSSGVVNIEEGAMLRGDISITSVKSKDVTIEDLDFEIKF